MKRLLKTVLTIGVLFFFNTSFAQSESMKEQEMIDMQKTAVLLTNIRAGTFQVEGSQAEFQKTLSKKDVLELCAYLKDHRPEKESGKIITPYKVSVYMVSEKEIRENTYSELTPFSE